MNDLFTDNYHYDLPQEKIALHPLTQRDQSKLLISKDGKIEHAVFEQLPEHLPGNSFLFFNDTKVIPARLHFRKETGAHIEIFLLNPVLPSPILAEAMMSTNTCTWHCTIGNLKRWTENKPLINVFNGFTIEAILVDRAKELVQFRWTPELAFATIIDSAGETPLPPYLKREAETADRERYQTIYSHHEGAVAAPTAGLHFTERVFQNLRKKNIEHDFVTLHVSAGTFQPIKTLNANDHIMHHEQIIISRKNIKNLLIDKFFIPVGTTSMRTMESLYWYGAKLLKDPAAQFYIQQHDPYTISDPPSRHDALKAVLQKMEMLSLDTLIGETSIFIKPGYTFRMCDALITNFHQPGSTLILLVAAFTGEHWKTIYNEALKNKYRFLSYGDSSLLFRER
jgi:S-adenosylmethionine:tRNA ribosyltransferase-isomerase